MLDTIYWFSCKKRLVSPRKVGSSRWDWRSPTENSDHFSKNGKKLLLEKNLTAALIPSVWASYILMLLTLLYYIPQLCGGNDTNFLFKQLFSREAEQCIATTFKCGKKVVNVASATHRFVDKGGNFRPTSYSNLAL